MILHLCLVFKVQQKYMYGVNLDSLILVKRKKRASPYERAKWYLPLQAKPADKEPEKTPIDEGSRESHPVRSSSVFRTKLEANYFETHTFLVSTFKKKKTSAPKPLSF
jgi:hypothetical protein